MSVVRCLRCRPELGSSEKKANRATKNRPALNRSGSLEPFQTAGLCVSLLCGMMKTGYKAPVKGKQAHKGTGQGQGRVKSETQA